jgi:hypothetical protein
MFAALCSIELSCLYTRTKTLACQFSALFLQSYRSVARWSMPYFTTSDSASRQWSQKLIRADLVACGGRLLAYHSYPRERHTVYKNDRWTQRCSRRVLHKWHAREYSIHDSHFKILELTSSGCLVSVRYLYGIDMERGHDGGDRATPGRGD